MPGLNPDLSAEPMRTKLRPITAHLHFLRSWPRMPVAATNKRITHVNAQCAGANKLGTASEKYMNKKARVISGFLVFIGERLESSGSNVVTGETLYRCR